MLTREPDTDLHSAQERMRYLQNILTRPSRTVMASGGNEPVLDVGGKGHSIFAEAFITGLYNMKEETFLAGELFYKYIKQRVGGSRSSSRAAQLPNYTLFKDTGDEGGDFVFRRIG